MLKNFRIKCKQKFFIVPTCQNLMKMSMLLSFHIEGNDYVVDYSHDIHSVIGRYAANTEELADLVREDYKLIDPEPGHVRIKFTKNYPAKAMAEVMEKLRLRKIKFICQERSIKSLAEQAQIQNLPRMY